ncbi:ribonuclease HI [Rhizobium pusense]|uniref:ribonuclease H family protein n=1 Tax=Agrobacterium pusense TaxID=648995 RepID=UPI00244AD6AD|nr:ribonuclease H [Agrobacterium pusense]MDH0114058.1 ribonuclease HI [Agrobacterium pusense]
MMVKRRTGKDFSPSRFAAGIHIFSDGAAIPNPGAGGWGVVVYEDGYALHSESGFAVVSTNNRMEMQGAIAALMWMRANGDPEAQLHTDSQYASKGANEWRHGWKNKRLMRGGIPIPNADLWQEMSAILDDFPISLNWVRGHSGIAGNEAADRMAVAAMKRGIKNSRSAA